MRPVIPARPDPLRRSERGDVMKVADVTRALEAIAPPSLASEWDNVGLLIGDQAATVHKLMLCVDLTDEVLAEAATVRAQMVMAYHPVIFKPLARVTDSDSHVVYQAIRQQVAVYSMHTALDAARGGSNDALADVLDLAQRRPLEPIVRKDRCKVVVFVPPDDLHDVADAAFAAGAGKTGNYYDCSFFVHGIGTFTGAPGARPTVGEAGRHEATEEMRLEVVAPRSSAGAVCAAIRSAHPYETPAIDVYPIEDAPDGCGIGRVGKLARPVLVRTLISRIKKQLGLSRVLVSSGDGAGKHGKPNLVATAACAAGSCGKLYRAALAAGATFYLTGEMRHHDALAAERAGMTVVCTGHSNSERIALKHVASRLKELLPKLRVVHSRRDMDPFRVV